MTKPRLSMKLLWKILVNQKGMVKLLATDFLEIVEKEMKASHIS